MNDHFPAALPPSSFQVGRRELVALGLLGSVAAPWVHAQSAKGSGGEWVFGQTIGLTGPEALLGKEVVSGLQLYFDYVNQQGGVNGTQVILKTLDDGYDVERAAANVRQLLAEGAQALITPLGTTTTLRVSKEAGDVPVVFPFTGTAGIRGKATPNTYFLRATYNDEVARIVSHSRQIGWSRMALIHSADPFGRAGLAAFTSALETNRLKPAAIGTTTDFRSTDMKAAVAAVAASGADAVLIYLPGTFADAVLALREAGLTIPIYGISVALTADTLNRTGRHRRGLMFTQVVPPWRSRKFPIVGRYLALLDAARLEPSYGGMEGFLNAVVAVEALRRAGGQPTRSSFVRAINNLTSFDAGGYYVQFDPQTRSGSKFVQIGVVDVGGNLLN